MLYFSAVITILVLAIHKNPHFYLGFNVLLVVRHFFIEHTLGRYVRYLEKISAVEPDRFVLHLITCFSESGSKKHANYEL